MRKVNLKKELSLGAYRLSAFYVARTSELVLEGFAWPFLYNPAVYFLSSLADDSFPVLAGLHFALLLQGDKEEALPTPAGPTPYKTLDKTLNPTPDPKQTPTM